MTHRPIRIAPALCSSQFQHAPSWRPLHAAATFVAVVLLTSACKSEDKDNAEAKSDATTTASTAAPVLDNKIANAVAQAAKSQTQPAPGADNGPPQDGVMGAVRADAELAKGAPPKVKLGSAGAEPRVLLGADDWGDKRPGQLEISVRNGPGAMPTTVFKLDVRKALTVTSAPATAEASPGASQARPTGMLPYFVDVVSSDLAATQPGEVPAELGVEIRKLKGSQFAAQVGPQGLLGTPSFTLAKGALPQLDSMLQAGATTLNDASVAYPKEPVGAGGFWMTTSRETLLGAEVIVYRMIKVTEIKDGNTVLDVSAKRYLAADTLGVAGLEQAKVVQFQAESSTQMMVPAGSALPLDGRAQTSIRAFVEIEGQPRPIQVESRSLFAFAPPAAPALKK